MSVKIGRGVREGCFLSPILFNLQRDCFTKEALKGFGGFKIGGQVIVTVKCADDVCYFLRKKRWYRALLLD